VQDVFFFLQHTLSVSHFFFSRNSSAYDYIVNGTHIYIYTYTNIQIYIYIYIYRNPGRCCIIIFVINVGGGACQQKYSTRGALRWVGGAEWARGRTRAGRPVPTADEPFAERLAPDCGTPGPGRTHTVTDDAYANVTRSIGNVSYESNYELFAHRCCRFLFFYFYCYFYYFSVLSNAYALWFVRLLRYWKYNQKPFPHIVFQSFFSCCWNLKKKYIYIYIKRHEKYLRSRTDGFRFPANRTRCSSNSHFNLNLRTMCPERSCHNDRR
jgi:hypothetical protein